MIKFISIIIFIMCIITACTALHNPQKTTGMGPCYGQAQPVPNVTACFFDVNGDQKPDIVLIYKWDTIKLVLELVDTLMINEYRDMFEIVD